MFFAGAAGRWMDTLSVTYVVLFISSPLRLACDVFTFVYCGGA